MTDLFYQDAPEHDHVWGPVEQPRFGGGAIQRCTVDGCRFVGIGYAEDDDYDESEDDDDENWSSYGPFAGVVVERPGQMATVALVEKCALCDSTAAAFPNCLPLCNYHDNIGQRDLP